ncbi:MAG: 3'-5' exonuclease DinG [Chlamydiia bacterium]|nr:3'-5' exonuclease DinG [Chlamydiia bacterium]
MKKKPIYYDTETTGVKPLQDKIVEIAAYDPVENKSFTSLVNPDMLIPPEASRIHNITDEMVKDAPSFLEVGRQFIEFCSGDVVLIAHNNDGFDKPLIEAEFSRNSIDIPSWDYLDSLKWARKYRPDLPRHSLQHLREVYGIEANNAHRALDDVVILHKVFSYLIGDLTMEDVLSLYNASKSELIRHMPFGKHKGSLLQDVPKNYVRWLNENGALDKADNEQLKKSFEKLGVLEEVKT